MRIYLKRDTIVKQDGFVGPGDIAGEPFECQSLTMTQGNSIAACLHRELEINTLDLPQEFVEAILHHCGFPRRVSVPSWCTAQARLQPLSYRLRRGWKVETIRPPLCKLLCFVERIAQRSLMHFLACSLDASVHFLSPGEEFQELSPGSTVPSPF